MCSISRAYDSYCDAELERYYEEDEPEPHECECCGEEFDEEPTPDGECPACVGTFARWRFWDSFCGPRQYQPMPN